MAKDQEELEGYEDGPAVDDEDDDLEVDDEVVDDDLVLDDDSEVDDDLVVDDADGAELETDAEVVEEDDEDTEASLDEILEGRAKAELVAVKDEDEDEDDDLLALVSDDVAGVTPLRAKITPVKEKQEFVCARCHLVKNRAQMADPKRVLCRDCV